MDAVERLPAAVDLQFLDRLPAQEGAEQTAQPEDMVKMPVREQNARQPFKANA